MTHIDWHSVRSIIPIETLIALICDGILIYQRFEKCKYSKHGHSARAREERNTNRFAIISSLPHERSMCFGDHTSEACPSRSQFLTKHFTFYVLRFHYLRWLPPFSRAEGDGRASPPGARGKAKAHARALAASKNTARAIEHSNFTWTRRRRPTFLFERAERASDREAARGPLSMWNAPTQRRPN